MALAGAASAGQILSPGDLTLILGGNMTMDDFEGNGLLPAGQHSDSFLNSTSTFSGFGPGLVQAGVDYSAGALF